VKHLLQAEDAVTDSTGRKVQESEQ